MQKPFVRPLSERSTLCAILQHLSHRRRPAPAVQSQSLSAHNFHPLEFLLHLHHGAITEEVVGLLTIHQLRTASSVLHSLAAMSSSTDPLEAAILHGIDANPTSSYREDRRPASTHSDHSPPNTDDELGSDLPDSDYDHDDDDHAGPAAVSHSRGGSSVAGMKSSRTASRGEPGATNTGPKGVLRDQQLRAQQESANRASAVRATNAKMASMALNSETYSEQVEREKRERAAQLQRENAESDDDAVSQTAIADLQAKERRREKRIAELQSARAAQSSALISGAAPNTTSGGAGGEKWFGHLREVDERGYVAAIDNEASTVPIVIHIYSKAVEQCNSLTSSLASLARQYPRTKFLQVQAAAIGFGKSSGQDEEDEEYDEFDSSTLEVLPTVLVYKGGVLVANLVRVDLDPLWGQGREKDVRDLLEHYGAIGAGTETTVARSHQHDHGDEYE